MKLRDQLLKEHSKSNCDKIVRWIGDDQSRLQAQRAEIHMLQGEMDDALRSSGEGEVR